jgi:hypothetical protein
VFVKMAVDNLGAHLDEHPCVDAARAYQDPALRRAASPLVTFRCRSDHGSCGGKKAPGDYGSSKVNVFPK